MKWHFKKICPTVASLFLAVSSVVNANYVDCSGFGCQLPSCTSYYSGGCAFHGDLLYWKARGSNITYNADFFSGSSLTEEQREFDGEELPVLILSQQTRVKNKNLRYHSDFGFRLGFTYDKCCSCWGLGLEYVHYHTDAHGKEPHFKCGILEQLNQEVEYEIDAKWDLYLDYVDFVAAREICLDPCFAFKAYFGIRYARLNQKYKSEAEYFGSGDFVVPFEFETAFAREVQDVNFRFEREDCFEVSECHLFNGAGPRIGIDLEWCLGCGWSIYGNAAFSFLVGYSNHDVKDNFDVSSFEEISSGVVGFSRQQQIFSETVIDEEDRIFCRDECLQANRPITDLALGVRWMPTFCCPYRISFQLGWEHHAFFGQKHAYFNDLQNPLKNCTSTLAVYGLTFSTNLSF